MKAYKPFDMLKTGNSEYLVLGVTAPDDLGAYRVYLATPNGVARCVVNDHGYVTTPRHEGKDFWWESYREVLCRQSIPHPNNWRTNEDSEQGQVP